MRASSRTDMLAEHLSCPGKLCGEYCSTVQRITLKIVYCRKKNVRRKLNAMALEFVGKNVLIVDDSIVRGTTSREIIQMAKDVGAKKVIVASCAPPIRSAVFLSLKCINSSIE